jgi:hypothetical protein
MCRFRVSAALAGLRAGSQANFGAESSHQFGAGMDLEGLVDVMDVNVHH